VPPQPQPSNSSSVSSERQAVDGSGSQAGENRLFRLPDKAFAAVFRTDDRAYRAAFAVFLTAMGLWTGVLICISPVDLIASPHDMTVHLDCAWRVLNGQVPHNDFYCCFGPGVPYLLGLGMTFSGPSIYAVVFLLLASGLGLGASAWMTARRRLGPPAAVLMSLTVFATTVGLAPLGWEPAATDYAMYYNRIGYAVLMVLALGCFVRRRINVAEPLSRTTAFFAGLGLAFLLSLKLTYFIIGVPFVVLAPAFQGRPGKWYCWSSLGFASLTLFCWLVLRVHPAAFLQDMRMVCEVARESRPPVLPQVTALALKLWPNLAALAVAWAAATWIRRKDLPTVCRFTLAVAVLIGADLLLGASNCQLPVAVLIPAEIVILYELALRGDSGDGYSDPGDRTTCRRSLNWLLLAAGILLGLQRIASELVGMKCAVAARVQRGSNGYPGRQIDAAPFKAVFVPANRNGLSDYPLFLNLGLELARKHVTKQSKLVSMEFSNPFNIALGLKPATGEATGWEPGKTFSRHTYPAPERVFADADFVITSRRGADVLWPVYGSYIEQTFQLVDRNQEWAIFGRVQPR
jgi:hypothetical protein